MSSSETIFPDHFTWGVSTSAYQIEGGYDADGKGQSIWDVFADSERQMWHGQTGKVACDHYHRYKEDIKLMAQLGIRAYRFSLSWPRILPDGTGMVNKAGLKFYDALIDGLLEHDIEPWVTLFHWDYPYELFLRGGWLNSGSPVWFEEYTRVIVDHFSDRVSKWMTISEPQCFIGLGYHNGCHAPGLKLSLKECLQAGHNTLLAHGRAVKVIRERSKLKPEIGWSPSTSIYRPASNNLNDINAAREASLTIYPKHVWNTSWWTDPVVFGHYPEAGFEAYGKSVPTIGKDDMEIISQPVDFYSCSLFHAPAVRMGAEGIPVAVELADGEAVSLHEWTMDPGVLYWGPRFIYERYKIPMIVTENGCSLLDQVGLDGGVHDPNRKDFIIGNLLALRRAIDENIDVRGYFHWSLMDTLEWQQGYKHRYGLVYVNFESLERIPKDSAYEYQKIITSNGECLKQYTHTHDEPVPYVVKEAMKYIENNITEVFNVKTIAAKLNCHPDFLSRRFKQYTGTSLSSHIRQVRLDCARNMLRDPKILISDVADYCGFSDRIHFTKVFRKEIGMTPREFQQQYRSQEDAEDVPAAAISNNPRATE